MQYKVVNYGLHGTFEELVEEALKDGWKLYGDLVVRADGGHFFQTMIKGEYEKPKEVKKEEENLDGDIRFCQYCGLDFRTVDYSQIADESYCPNCGRLKP